MTTGDWGPGKTGLRIETRKRRANARLTAAIVCTPVLQLVAVAAVAPSYIAYEGSAAGWKDVGVGVLILLGAMLIGLGYAWTQKYWREKSPSVAIVFGLFAGTLGLLVPLGMLDVLVDDKKLLGIGAVIAAVVGWVLPGWLATRGQRALWEPIDDELIDSDLDVVVRGRNKVKLSLDAMFLTIKGPGGIDLFEDLRDVESVTVTKSLNEERRDATGNGDEITVSPGAAVRIRMVRGEWYVPADDADAVAQLITRRRDKAIADGPEDEEEPDEDGEVVFHARRDRKLTLTVDEDQLTLSGDRPGELLSVSLDLDEVESVEVTSVDTEARRDITGEEDEALVTVGQALLIKHEDGEWLFPVDRAGEIAKVLTDRVERYRLEDEAEDQVG